MKKAIILLLLALVMITGCSVHDEISAREDEVAIGVDISEISEDIYRLDMNYYLDGELMGGLAVSAVNQKPLRKEPYAFYLDRNSFPEDVDLSRFSFDIRVQGDDTTLNEMFSESEHAANTGKSEIFAVEYGKVYNYIITGSFEEGFKLEKTAHE